MDLPVPAASLPGRGSSTDCRCATPAVRARCGFVSFDAKEPVSSVHTIDKAISGGHEPASYGTIPPSMAPPRLPGNRQQSGRGASHGRSANRRRSSDVRARVEQRRELRVATGGWSACFCRLARRACCRLPRVLQRAPTGVSANGLPTPPTGYPRHLLAHPGTTTRPLGHLPVTQPPQGAWGRNRPNCVPMPSRLHTITSRHPLAPPARAARSRRPLAPPVRAARSRRPLAPSAHAAASLHRHRTLMVSLDLPIPSHLHTITSRHPLAPPARAARLRRPLAPPARAARSRRPLAPPACVRHAALLALRRFGDAPDVSTGQHGGRHVVCVGRGNQRRARCVVRRVPGILPLGLCY